MKLINKINWMNKFNYSEHMDELMWNSGWPELYKNEFT